MNETKMSGSPETCRDRTKRRISILKPVGPKNPQTETTTPKLTRRVSFASARSIKPFAQDPEQNTIWDNSYQEFVNHTDSTQSSQDQVSSKLCMTMQATLEIDNVTGYNGSLNVDKCVTQRNFSITETVVNSVIHNESLQKWPGSIIDYVKQSRSMSGASIYDSKNEINPYQEQLTEEGSASMDIEETVFQEKNSNNDNSCYTYEKPAIFMGLQNSTVSKTAWFSDKENISHMEFHKSNEKLATSSNNPWVVDKENIFSKSNMELTCQIPGNEIIKIDPNAINSRIDKKNVYIRKSSMKFNCENKSSEDVIFDHTSIASRRSQPVDPEHISLRNASMEFTCQIPRAIFSESKNSTLNQSNAALDNTGMEFTCQFPPVSKATLPVDDRNVVLEKSRSALQNIDMEFTCQGPRTMLPASRNVTLNQSQGDMDNTGMEFTCQFPPTSRTTLPVDETNAGLEKSRSALQNIDMEFTCQIPREILSASRNVTLNQSKVAMEFTCQFPPASRATLPVDETNAGLEKSRSALQNIDMEFTCQNPRAMLPASRNVTLNQSQGGMDNTGMEFTCQFPPTSRTTLQVDETNAGLEKSRSALQNIDMEFTCQNSRAMLPASRNVTLNQSQVGMDNTGMEFTCQFPPTSKATLPVDKTNAGLEKSRSALQNIDMEFTCQIPREILSASRNVTLNQSKVAMDNTGMEFTSQFPPTSRATLPVNDTNAGLEKSRSALQNIDMEFTCQIPREILSASRNVTLNQSKVAMDNTGMEFTCQFPPTSRATLPVDETNAGLEKSRSALQNIDMEFTCQIPREILPASRNVTLNQNKVAMDNTGMEFTCQFPPTSRATLPVDETNAGLEKSRSALQNIDMEFTCQIPREILSASRNVTLNQSKVAMDHTGMEFTSQFPPASRVTVPTNERYVAFDKSKSALQNIDMEFTCQIPTTMLPTSTNFDKFKGAGKEFPLSSKTILPADVKESRVDLEHTRMATSKAMLPVEVGNLDIENSKLQLESNDMEVTCQVPRTVFPVNSNATFNQSKNVLKNSQTKFKQEVSVAAGAMLSAQHHNLEKSRGTMENTRIQFRDQVTNATLPTSKNLSINKSKNLSQNTSMEFASQLPTVLSGVFPVNGVLEKSTNALECSDQFQFDNKTNEKVSNTNNVQWLSTLAESTVHLPFVPKADFVTKQNVSLKKSNMESNCQSLKEIKEELSTTLKITNKESFSKNNICVEIANNMQSSYQTSKQIETSATVSRKIEGHFETDVEFPVFDRTSAELDPDQQELNVDGSEPCCVKVLEETSNIESNCQNTSRIAECLKFEDSSREVLNNAAEEEVRDTSSPAGDVTMSSIPSSLRTPENQRIDLPKSTRPILDERSGGLYSDSVNLKLRSFETVREDKVNEIIVNPATPENVSREISKIPVAKSPYRITSRFPHDDKLVSSAIHGEFENNRLTTPKAPTPNREKLNKTNNLKPKPPVFSQSPEPSFQINLSTISDNNTCQISSFVKPKLESFINSINEVREDTRAQLSQHFSHVSFPNVTDISDLSIADPPRDLEVPDVSFSTVPLSNRFLQANDTYFVNRKRNYDKETEVNTSSDSQDLSHLLERTKLDYLVESEDCSFSQSNIRQALANVRLDEFVCPIKKVNVKKRIENIQQQSREIEAELLNFQLDQYVLPDLIDKEETDEECGESYEESQCQEMQIEFPDLSSPQKLPTLEEKIRELQNRSQYWTLEGNKGSTYTFSTLCGTVIFTVQLNRTNEIVTNINTKTSLQRDCLPLNVYTNMLFVARMRSDNITAAIGPHFNIMSLLDYVELTYRKFLEFYMDMNEYLTKYGATIDENLIAKFEMSNASLVTFFEVFVDLKNLENLTENDIKIEQKIGEIKQNDVKMLAKNCPKNCDFIHSYINNIEEYLEKRKKYLRKP